MIILLQVNFFYLAFKMDCRHTTLEVQ